MTSSLVGSEMCIRDRHWKGLALEFRGQLERTKRTVEGGKDRDCFVDPVSYTHLTLPTICSV
eukprot:10197897-Prorocentrum_lima.AAC.1